MFSFTNKTRKKTLRYKVVVKGVTISKHSTKRLATSKAKGIFSAKVVPLTTRRRKSRY